MDQTFVETMLNQMLDEYDRTGDRQAALEQLQMLSEFGDQKVMGVIYARRNDPSVTTIVTLEGEGILAEHEESRREWQSVWVPQGYVYSGPNLLLPTGMCYAGKGLVANLSGNLEVVTHVSGDVHLVSVCAEGNAEVTMLFEGKKDLQQYIDRLTACLRSTGTQ